MFVFRLDTHSGVPPYLQLVQQVRQAVLLGFLQPGDRLPLIREVVEELAINPNTVAKAYRQMEQENLVTGRPGQGTFVDEQQSAAMPASTYTSLRRGLETWLRRAYAAGLDEQAVNALFTSIHQQTRNEDHQQTRNEDHQQTRNEDHQQTRNEDHRQTRNEDVA